MKNVVMLCMILATLVSCKQTESGAIEENTTATVDTLAAATPTTLAPCGLSIVVDLDKITDSTQRASWVGINSKYYCTPITTTTPSTECSTNKVHVDLLQIKGTSTTDTYIKRSEWLQKYGEYICFEETYCNIASSHEITDIGDKEELEGIVDTKLISSYTLEEIKNEVNKQKGDFEGDTYKKFLFFSYSGGKLMLNVKDTYQDPYVSYSLPFLRSIIYCNTFASTNPTFQFINYQKTTTATPTVVIKVRVKKTGVGGYENKFYDYSQQPQKK